MSATTSPDNTPANTPTDTDQAPIPSNPAPPAPKRRARRPAKTRTDNPTSSDKPPIDAVEVENASAPGDNEATFGKVLELIGSSLSTRQACCAAGLDPKLGPSILWKWAQRTEDSRTRYARARDAQARAMADDTVGIADAATPETAQVAKLQGDARRWLASKLLPKEYGERLDVESRSLVANVNLSELSDDQVRRLASGESPLSVLGGERRKIEGGQEGA